MGADRLVALLRHDRSGQIKPAAFDRRTCHFGERLKEGVSLMKLGRTVRQDRYYRARLNPEKYPITNEATKAIWTL